MSLYRLAILLLILFIGIIIGKTAMINQDLSTTQPVPIKPNYYTTGQYVKAYPKTANTHILKQGIDTYIVFQMETEFRPIVLQSKIGECNEY